MIREKITRERKQKATSDANLIYDSYNQSITVQSQRQSEHYSLPLRPELFC